MWCAPRVRPGSRSSGGKPRRDFLAASCATNVGSVGGSTPISRNLLSGRSLYQHPPKARPLRSARGPLSTDLIPRRARYAADQSLLIQNIPDRRVPQTTKSVTPPASVVPQEKCLACHNYGPPGKIVKCQECGFKTHAGTFGVIAESLDVDNWLCEICQNDKVQEASLDTSCLLCPRARRDPKDGAYPSPDTFLRAQKPTEGQGWVHVVCSVFIPELTFSDTMRLRLVEGISVINPHRWLTVGPNLAHFFLRN